MASKLRPNRVEEVQLVDGCAAINNSTYFIHIDLNVENLMSNVRSICMYIFSYVNNSRII